MCNFLFGVEIFRIERGLQAELECIDILHS